MANYKREAFITVNGLQFGGRITFQIEKGMLEAASPTSPAAKISIYNLSPKSRSHIESSVGPGSLKPVKLDVGYAGRTSLLFLGTVDKPVTERKGSDIIMTLECRDSGLVIGKTYMELSFDGQVDGNRIVNECARALGLKWGMVASCASVVYKNGFCWCDQAIKCLHLIANAAGMVVTINDGVLNITPQGQGTGEPVVVLNKNTGLLGYPSKTVDTKNVLGVSAVYVAKSQLNPLLMPGRYVQLESKDFTLPARLVVLKAKFNGDSQEGPWDTDIEAAVPGTQAFTPQVAE